jgi:uncharacterized membrane protein
MNTEAIKIIIPSIITFIVGILLTPFVSSFLYKKKNVEEDERRENNRRTGCYDY